MIDRKTKYNTLIFDLDGTIVDSSERMYQLFRKLIPESTMTKDEYWSLKRNKINHEMILKTYYPSRDFREFNRQWLTNIELDEYLDMDSNYPDTIEVLSQLSKTHNLILLTARQIKRNLIKEMDRLQLSSFFTMVLVTEGIIEKEKLFLKYCDNISRNSLFVSDMGKDIIWGNRLGYKTVAITHGFMNREKLVEYKPYYLIHDLSELLFITGCETLGPCSAPS